MTESTEIPVLDLAPLISGDDTTTLAADLADAYGNTGFGYVINHGVDRKRREAVFATSKLLSLLRKRNSRRSRWTSAIAVTSL